MATDGSFTTKQTKPNLPTQILLTVGTSGAQVQEVLFSDWGDCHNLWHHSVHGGLGVIIIRKKKGYIMNEMGDKKMMIF